MDIEKTLEKIGIKKILISDHVIKNACAANHYLKNFNKIEVDYAISVPESIKKIEEAYSSSKYDLVLTSMEMGNGRNGLEISEKTFEHQGIAGIIFEKENNREGKKISKPKIDLLIGNHEFFIYGKKESPNIWEKLFRCVKNYLEHEGKEVLNLMEEHYSKYHQPSTEFGNFFNRLYETRANFKSEI
jgi:sulfite reductase alpha subunit-like flavoprotein